MRFIANENTPLTPQNEIESFLSQLKVKLTVFGVAFRNRDKNLDALADLDITPKYREEILMALTVEDYCSGPIKDNEIPGRQDYFEFGKNINGKEVYIKLSLGRTGKMVDCISFHPAEWPMKYPLKPQPPHEEQS